MEALKDYAGWCEEEPACRLTAANLARGTYTEGEWR